MAKFIFLPRRVAPKGCGRPAEIACLEAVLVFLLFIASARVPLSRVHHIKRADRETILKLFTLTG